MGGAAQKAAESTKPKQRRHDNRDGDQQSDERKIPTAAKLLFTVTSEAVKKQEIEDGEETHMIYRELTHRTPDLAVFPEQPRVEQCQKPEAL